MIVAGTTTVPVMPYYSFSRNRPMQTSIDRGQYSYNGGRCYASVWKNPSGTGYVVMATNVPSGESMAVRNPIERLEDAHAAARAYAGVTAAPIDPDAYEQRLSEQLGF